MDSSNTLKIFILVVVLSVSWVYAAPSPPHHVVSEANLMNHLEGALASGKTAVIRFYANWCPVCQSDAPEFLKVVDKHPDSSTKFFKIDVDEQPDLVRQYGVTAVPTYFVLTRGKQHVTFHGANDVDGYLQQRRSS